MQAEYGRSRGNGFIIVPSETLSSPVREHISKNYDVLDKLSDIKESLSNAADACSSYAKAASKKQIHKVFSLSAVICSLLIIFNIFTFATGIYGTDSRIASAKDRDDFFSALKEAKAVAASYGIYNFDVSFSTSPVLSLRSEVCSEDELRDKILLSSGLFVDGCSLYIGNNKIFDAESYDTAHTAVNEYISSYSMNGSATLSEQPEYRKCVIPKTMVSGKDKCVEKLKTSDNINVVSIVNATSVKVVPYETRTENDSTMFVGETVTVTEGTNGNMQISEETVYKNGKAQSVRISSEKITAKPVARVVRVGTKYKKVLESGLFYPLEGILSSPFGSRWGSVHEGIDIAVEEGTPVKAAECGTVSRVSENAGGYGKLIQIDHGYGVETVYAHLSEIQVSEGQSVSAGSVIGLSGNTGRSTGPHLHFEITSGGTPIDPLKYLN